MRRRVSVTSAPIQLTVLFCRPLFAGAGHTTPPTTSVWPSGGCCCCCCDPFASVARRGFSGSLTVSLPRAAFVGCWRRRPPKRSALLAAIVRYGLAAMDARRGWRTLLAGLNNWPTVADLENLPDFLFGARRKKRKCSPSFLPVPLPLAHGRRRSRRRRHWRKQAKRNNNQ